MLLRLYNWSDLHLENEELNFEKLLANLILEDNYINILSLTGDISTPTHKSFITFFDRVSKLFNHVLYVAGNHEYHSNSYTYHELNKMIKHKLSHYHNVHFLDNDTFKIEDIVFIGTTLWSYIPPYLHQIISKGISDYKSILWNKTRYITPSEINILNNKAVLFIEEVLEKYNKNRIIILTHHSPLFSSPRDGLNLAKPEHYNDLKNYSYHNNLIKLFRDPIKAWIFGHTHYRKCYNVNGVILWTHQYGYTDELKGNYDINLYLELKI